MVLLYVLPSAKTFLVFVSFPMLKWKLCSWFWNISSHHEYKHSCQCLHRNQNIGHCVDIQVLRVLPQFIDWAVNLLSEHCLCWPTTVILVNSASYIVVTATQIINRIIVYTIDSLSPWIIFVCLKCLKVKMDSLYVIRLVC